MQICSVADACLRDVVTEMDSFTRLKVRIEDKVTSYLSCGRCLIRKAY